MSRQLAGVGGVAQVADKASGVRGLSVRRWTGVRVSRRYVAALSPTVSIGAEVNGAPGGDFGPMQRGTMTQLDLLGRTVKRLGTLARVHSLPRSDRP
jgi:hypothetical protein